MKQTKDLKLKGSGGITDLFDNHVKSAFNLTDEEYDFICTNATDEELDVLVNSDATFALKRKMIEIRKKYLSKFDGNL